MDLGCHMINLLHWYFGEVSHVTSYLGYRFNLDVEDHATCLLKYQNGQIAVVNVGWFSQQTHQRVDLHGTVGTAYATYKAPNKIQYSFPALSTGEDWLPGMSLPKEGFEP